jgi:hypothetical protein
MRQFKSIQFNDKNRLVKWVNEKSNIEIVSIVPELVHASYYIVFYYEVVK